MKQVLLDNGWKEERENTFEPIEQNNRDIPQPRLSIILYDNTINLFLNSYKRVRTADDVLSFVSETIRGLNKITDIANKLLKEGKNE